MAKLDLICERIEPIVSASVLTLTPTIKIAYYPQCDVICVPDGAPTSENAAFSWTSDL